MSSKLLAGRYELIEKIGEGGMAVVYKAKCRLLNRYVAIKILRPEFTKDAQFVENFKRESQAAAGLQSPNIVSVYDVGKEGDIHFIVMELVDGRPLSEVIEEEAPMDYKKAIDITRQVASALSLAHRNHIIHRDVKPHNIMITRDGIAKLGDFGIAKAVSDSTLVTETSRIIGSVHYFSPEQARGSYVDERSDIYSLGIVLYEMLTGTVPFDGENPVQIALMHINDDIIPPSKVVGGIPPALEKLVMKSTDKFQSNRFKNVDEMLEEIDNIEFVTKMVGESIFAASDVEEYREQQKKSALSAEEIVDTRKPSKKKKELSQEEKEKKRKKKKAIIIIAASLCAAVAITLGALYGFGVIGGSKEGNITVPDLSDMTYEQAETKLTELKLVIKKGDKVPSDTIEEGKIVSQTPKAGKKVNEGDTVTVNISSGKESGTVPNLIGKKYDSAAIQKELDKYKFKLGNVTYEESDKYEKDVIISQNPGGGNNAEEGAYISIVVSSGKPEEKVTVPNLLNLTLEQATEQLKNAGLEIGDVTYGESSSYAAGSVMWQQYSSGNELAKGSKISVKLAKEATPPTPAP